jgi:hypothetical protein
VYNRFRKTIEQGFDNRTSLIANTIGQRIDQFESLLLDTSKKMAIVAKEATSIPYPNVNQSDWPFVVPNITLPYSVPGNVSSEKGDMKRCSDKIG